MNFRRFIECILFCNRPRPETESINQDMAEPLLPRESVVATNDLEYTTSMVTTVAPGPAAPLTTSMETEAAVVMANPLMSLEPIPSMDGETPDRNVHSTGIAAPGEEASSSDDAEPDTPRDENATITTRLLRRVVSIPSMGGETPEGNTPSSEVAAPGEAAAIVEAGAGGSAQVSIQPRSGELSVNTSMPSVVSSADFAAEVDLGVRCIWDALSQRHRNRVLPQASFINMTLRTLARTVSEIVQEPHIAPYGRFKDVVEEVVDEYKALELFTPPGDPYERIVDLIKFIHHICKIPTSESVEEQWRLYRTAISLFRDVATSKKYRGPLMF